MRVDPDRYQRMASGFTRWWRERRRVRAIHAARAAPRSQTLVAAAHALPERPRILLLKLDHIGDLVLAMRAMLRIRKAWPDAHITLVCGPWNVALARQLGLFDRIIAYRFLFRRPPRRASSRVGSACRIRGSRPRRTVRSGDRHAIRPGYASVARRDRRQVPRRIFRAQSENGAEPGASDNGASLPRRPTAAADPRRDTAHHARVRGRRGVWPTADAPHP